MGRGEEALRSRCCVLMILGLARGCKFLCCAVRCCGEVRGEGAEGDVSSCSPRKNTRAGTGAGPGWGSLVYPPSPTFRVLEM